MIELQPIGGTAALTSVFCHAVLSRAGVMSAQRSVESLESGLVLKLFSNSIISGNQDGPDSRGSSQFSPQTGDPRRFWTAGYV